jgi:hypothetical protein
MMLTTDRILLANLFHPLGPTFLDRHLHGPVPSKKACAKLNFRLCRVRQQYPSVFGTLPPSRKRPYFATAAFSHNTTRSDFIEGLGLLTTSRLRRITSSSWRLRALIMGMGQHCLKTPPISPDQGTMAC